MQTDGGLLLMLLLSCTRVLPETDDTVRGYYSDEETEDTSTEGSASGFGTGRGQTAPVDPKVSDPCAARYICSLAEGDTSYEDKNCACDTMCHVYGDCCQNVERKALQRPLDELSRNVRGHGECQEISGHEGPVFVVNACPEGYSNEETVRLCARSQTAGDDVFLRVPVSHRVFGVIYSNLYCALCHGWDRGEVTFWNVELTCTVRQDYDGDFLYPLLSYEMPSLHEGEPSNTTTDNEGIYFSTQDPGMEESNDRNYDNMTVDEIINEADSCNWIFQAPASVPSRPCRKVISDCSPDWNNDTTRRHCLLGPNAFVYEQVRTFKNKYCALCNHNNFYSCFQMMFTMSERGYMDVPLFQGPAVVSVSVLLDFNSGEKRTSKKGAAQTVTERKSCQEGHVYDVLSETCRPLFCDKGYKLVNFKCSPEWTGINDIDSSTGNSSDFTNCPKFEVDVGKYVLLPNRSAFLNSSFQILKAGQFQVSENTSTLYYCAYNLSRDYAEVHNGTFSHVTQHGIIEGVISLTGQVISVTSLLILLLIYCTNRQLQTLPGKCLMSLSLSLMLAQLLFIAGIFVRRVPYICQSIAAATQYCFLTSFFWMNIMAFDVWRTFHKQFIYATNSKTYKKFAYYSVYCCTLPGLIVAISITLHNHNMITYGLDLCWIINKTALLYLFALPLFVILFINVIFFTLSVYNIYKASRGADVLHHRKNGSAPKRKRLILYMKLSTVMGLTWIFGFLAATLGHTFLWYLFIVFNTLQGLFIFLAFACNKKVLGLVRQKLSLYTEITGSSSRSTEISKKSTLETAL